MGVFRQILNQLHLIGLALFLHELDGLFPGQLKALELELFLADLAHLALDLLHDLGGDGEGRVQVIIEAVFNGRADGQLHLRIEALDGLGQDMGAGMPIRAAILLIFKGILVVFLRHDGSSLSLRGEKKSRP